jgi:hypothetical protein
VEERKTASYNQITAARISLELAKRFNPMYLILAADPTNVKETLQDLPCLDDRQANQRS